MGRAIAVILRKQSNITPGRTISREEATAKKRTEAARRERQRINRRATHLGITSAEYEEREANGEFSCSHCWTLQRAASFRTLSNGKRDYLCAECRTKIQAKAGANGQRAAVAKKEAA